MIRDRIFLLGLVGTLPMGCVVGTFEPTGSSNTNPTVVGGNASNTGGSKAQVGGATGVGGTHGTLTSGALGGSDSTSVGGDGVTGGTSNSALGGASSVGGGESLGGSMSVGGSHSGGAAIEGGSHPLLGGSSNAGGSQPIDTWGLGGSSLPGGGETALGGAVATGGVSNVAVGGATDTLATGGASPATGGDPGAGGSLATGGATNLVATGGAAPETGGAPPATGGAAPETGGMAATGGSSSVASLAPAAIVAGDTHACALLNNGTVWCWGSNASGQLGVDWNTLWGSNAPIQVSLDPGSLSVKALTAGGRHTCALLSDGTAKCWGRNIYGQLGIGTYADTIKPTTVLTKASVALSGIVSIDAGYDFTCATVKDSAYGSPIAKCWGDGEYGQLGDGRSGSEHVSAYPVNVVTNTTDFAPLADVSSVTTGDNHACAQLSDKGVHCWGANAYGQLGDGTTNTHSLPVPVVDGNANRVSSDKLALGIGFTCSMLGSAVQCWGDNDRGQLGAGATDSYIPKPVSVKQKANAAQLSAGGYVACIIDADGAVECWGDGEYGQLGLDVYATPCNNATYTCSNTPVLVPFPNPSVDNRVAVSSAFFTLVLDVTGRISSIGDNGSGQLGNCNDTPSYTANPQTVCAAWNAR